MGTILTVHRSPNADNEIFFTLGTTDSSGGITWGDPNHMWRSSISGPALVSFGGTIYCVYGTTDGYLKSTTWNKSANSWSADTSVAGMSDSTVSLVVFNNTLFCIHRGYDDTALYYTTTTDGTTWSASQPLTSGGGIRSGAGPASIVIVDENGNNQLFVVFRDIGASTNLFGSTYSGDGWTNSYNTSTNGNPMSASQPALLNFGGRTYCVHRGGGGEAKNGDQIWTCTLHIVSHYPDHSDPIIQVDYSGISNQTYQTPSGPALATDGTHMWVFYGSHEEPQQLYYASWSLQDPWKNSYWAGEANAPNDALYFEPAAIYYA